jgi:hypothetical protein
MTKKKSQILDLIFCYVRARVNFMSRKQEHA